MPIAIIAAGVAAVGSVAGAVISSNAAKSAARTAAETADKNNALSLQVRNENAANFNPYMQRGNSAGDATNALLGLPGANGQTDPTAARNAFNAFTGSDGYQFRLDQGLKSAQTNYAAKGFLQSGAALKGLNNYAQGQASDEFGKYLGYLGNQQSLGFASANALAGNNNNYASSVTNNNNNASNAAGNAAMASANAWNGAISGVTNAFATYAGTQSSYGGKNKSPATYNPGFSNKNGGF